MILLFEIACPFTAGTATPAFIALWAVSKIFIVGYFSAFPFICPRFHYRINICFNIRFAVKPSAHIAAFHWMIVVITALTCFLGCWLFWYSCCFCCRFCYLNRFWCCRHNLFFRGCFIQLNLVWSRICSFCICSCGSSCCIGFRIIFSSRNRQCCFFTCRKKLVSAFSFTSLFLTEQPTNTLISTTATIHKITDFFIKHSSFAFTQNLTDFGNSSKGAFTKSYTSFLYLIYKARSFLQVCMLNKGVYWKEGG